MITRRTFTQAVAAGSLCLGRRALASDHVATKKRGCCFVARPDGKWRTRIKKLRPHWLYTWGRRIPEGLPEGVEFTPMLWGDAQPERQGRRIADLKELAAAGKINHLLAFNEPDQHEQANMTVDRAVELWPDLMDVGVPLVSPGCVHPDRKWMNAFMDVVERDDLRVDAIAVHSYMGPSVEILVRRLEKVHERFGRPLWITEFAVGDWEAKTRAENRHPPERILAFMKELLPILDAAPFVHRYSWFSAGPSSGPLGTSALLDEAGELTELGELYAAHTG